MSKQTAVQWLLQELEEEKLIKLDKLSTIRFNRNFATRYELIIEQALQMEREQMEEAVSNGISKADMTNHRGYFDFDKWYNETYGGQDEK